MSDNLHSLPPEISGLRRVFLSGFLARDIAEPLQSFDKQTPIESLRQWFESKRGNVAGIREAGEIVGFVHLDDAMSDSLKSIVQPIPTDITISGDTPLSEVILRLVDESRLFITAFGSVAGIITHNDLQKPPLRMWLFGLITIIEMRWTRMIDELFDEAELRQQLSAGRLEKAETLLAERLRRNQSPRLLDCIQFSEKGQIVARTEALRVQTIFKSAREMKGRIKQFEGLRNNLAHSQDILGRDWDVIIGLTQYVTQLWDSPTVVTSDS